MAEAAGKAIDRVDIGIVVAMPLEAAAIVERLRESVTVRAGDRRVTIGRLGRAFVAVIATGVGGDAAVRGTRLVAEGHRPDRIVAAGLCGGLDPGLARGAIVAADQVVLAPGAASSSDGRAATPAAGHRLAVDQPSAERRSGADAGVVRGLLATSGGVVGTPTAKRALREATGAVAVDMESWWVVEAARRLGLPVHVVRVVCDTADETVPADIASLATAGSAARLAGAAVRLLWNRPAAAIDMVELRERACAAADSLALRLEAMFGG